MEAYFGHQTYLSNSEHVHILSLEECWRNNTLTLHVPATVRHRHWLSFLPITQRNLISGQVLKGGRQPGNLTCWGDLGWTKECFFGMLKHQHSHPSAVQLLYGTRNWATYVLTSCKVRSKSLFPSVAVALLTFQLHSGKAPLLKATH